jgi:gas vesicle protein
VLFWRAAAGAAAVVLSDEKKRKAIKSKVNQMAKDGSKKIHELTEKAGDFGEQAKETISEKAGELQDKVAKVVHDAKKAMK